MFRYLKDFLSDSSKPPIEAEWLNNCVGKRNYTPFILLMDFVFLMVCIATLSYIKQKHGKFSLIQVTILIGAIFVRCFVETKGMETEMKRRLYVEFPGWAHATILYVGFVNDLWFSSHGAAFPLPFASHQKGFLVNTNLVRCVVGLAVLCDLTMSPGLVTAMDFLPIFFISYRPCYNVAPGSYMPVLRKDSDGVAVHCMKWGVVPAFTNKTDKPDFFKMFNARSESVAEKTSFR